MEHQIIGTTMPVLEIQLAPNESVIAESGELSWMSPSISMTTSAGGGLSGGGGLFGAVKRMAGGGGLFLTTYTAQPPGGLVAFAAKLPGQIFPIQVSSGGGYMAHKHGFLCGTPGIGISMGFQQSLGAGIFGGEGFILQQIGGEGIAYIELSGEIIVRDLQPGESLLVHPGHVGLFQAGMPFQIVTIRGIKNKLFGGDGIFLASLTGPGRIWLQSMPIPGLANAIAPYLPQPNIR